MTQKITATQVSLPKGGGAIKGIGEPFQHSGFSGTGYFRIPIPITSSRDFSPKLSLGYNSGSDNGSFGLGFDLSLHKISRKTSTGIPKYDDSDVFIFSEEGELTPKLKKSDEQWIPIIKISENKLWDIHTYLVSGRKLS